ncbi:MAG: hypothetical protein MZV63_42200 [Marinilabiliales bacterium]|nr:hypothetical protein [Marinilabiliales bacterium]
MAAAMPAFRSDVVQPVTAMISGIFHEVSPLFQGICYLNRIAQGDVNAFTDSVRVSQRKVFQLVFLLFHFLTGIRICNKRLLLNLTAAGQSREKNQ